MASFGLAPLQIDSTHNGLLGASRPFFAFLIISAIFEVRAGFCTLFNRLLTWCAGIQLYLFVLFWTVIISLAKTGIAVVLRIAIPDYSQPPFAQLTHPAPELLRTTTFIGFTPFIYLEQMLIGSSMVVEPGWR
jgi:hypothetical protein